MKPTTPRDIVRKWRLTPQQEIFLMLYLLGGYSMIDAYRYAHPNSRATIGMSSQASHLLSVLEPAARQIADAVRDGGIQLPKRFQK